MNDVAFLFYVPLAYLVLFLPDFNRMRRFARTPSLERGPPLPVELLYTQRRPFFLFFIIPRSSVCSFWTPVFSPKSPGRKFLFWVQETTSFLPPSPFFPSRFPRRQLCFRLFFRRAKGRALCSPFFQTQRWTLRSFLRGRLQNSFQSPSKAESLPATPLFVARPSFFSSR